MRLSLNANDLIEKVKALLPALEERGTVYLFAFAQHAELDRWDVVISSDWSDKDSVAAVRFIADYMRPRFGIEELTLISRIAVIPSSDPKVHDLLERWGRVEPRDNLVDYSKRIYGDAYPAEFLGSDVRLVFVFKTELVPVAAPIGSLTAVGAHP